MSLKEHWKSDPDDHDYPAAANYLSLLLQKPAVDVLVSNLRAAPLGHWKAKDLLRASRLPLLARDNIHVALDLKKVERGDKLSPVLIIRGDLNKAAPVEIADGYHRVCASYYLDEDADIPCRMTDNPAG